MPFCAAAAVVVGHPQVDTFDEQVIADRAVQDLMRRVDMRTNPSFDGSTPLSRTTVTVTLHDGRRLERSADGARGYPGRLSTDDLAAKFVACAARALTPSGASEAWNLLQTIEDVTDVRQLTAVLVP